MKPYDPNQKVSLKLETNQRKNAQNSKNANFLNNAYFNNNQFID
jgi:cytochrome c-type biogenesis protein CcmH/NrfG